MRESFVFYMSYHEAISELDETTQLKLYQAICEYALIGKEMDLSGVPKAIFRLIKPTIDANEKRYKNGKNGGRPKKEITEINNNNEIEKPNDNQTETKIKPNVNDNDNVNVNDNVNIPPKSPKGEETDSDAFSESFEDFWKAYPKKNAKAKALKAWNKLKPDDDLVRLILCALEKQKKSSQWLKEDGQFIPYPSTWLNGKRWEDELNRSDNNAEQSSGYKGFVPSKGFKG